jgi:NADH-quinone oxidoreductase subunit H
LWAVFFLAEYAMMLILSLVMCYLFFGGSASPIPDFGRPNISSQPSFFWLLTKSWLIGLSMIWIRWTLPRMRVDQLMSLGWKVLTPVSLAGFLAMVLIY